MTVAGYTNDPVNVLERSHCSAGVGHQVRSFDEREKGEREVQRETGRGRQTERRREKEREGEIGRGWQRKRGGWGQREKETRERKIETKRERSSYAT